MRENLIVVRAGPKSLHPTWLEGDPHRTWDLLLCPYAPLTLREALATKGVLISRTMPGLKYVGIRALFASWPFIRLWQSYQYIMLADDDLEVVPGTWTKFFKIVAENNAALAAPALTIGSVASYPVTVQQAPTGVRRTTFVEIMTPCFRVDVLEKLLPTFKETPSGLGWGLDYCWAKILAYQDIFVVDETPVTHSRPSNNDPAVSQRGLAEMKAMMKKYDAPPLENNL